jgi:hypothetical protein
MIALFAAASFSCAFAGAPETQLTGAWAESDANCKDTFVSVGARWKFREPRDMFGSGFIVEGRQYVGPFGECRLSSVTPKGDRLLLALSCHNTVGYSDQVTPVRLKSSNELEIFLAAMDGTSVTFQRCVR